MILKSGCVKVEHVRQKKSWNFTTNDEQCFGVNFYKLKETSVRLLPLTEDEVVTLEHSNNNQEIEVIRFHRLYMQAAVYDDSRYI